MVHIEHTSIAQRAMMTSFRLKHIADQAISLSLQIMVSQMKPPKSWNLAGVCYHCLDQAPAKHAAKTMIKEKHNFGKV